MFARERRHSACDDGAMGTSRPTGALPSKVEAMYAPELRGNATEWKASVSDE
jgi:hypothetical protein